MSKLTKDTIAELVRIAVSAIVSVLTALGVMSCTVNSGNRENHTEQSSGYHSISKLPDSINVNVKSETKYLN